MRKYKYCECFSIGGSAIYKLLMPYCNKIYVTEIDKDFDGDVYFPKFSSEQWKVTEREQGHEDDENDFNYEYVTYERV